MSQPTNYKKGHKLTEISPENRTATCKICGEVNIVKSAIVKGKQYYRCRNTFDIKTKKAPYIKEHFLSNIDEEAKSGTCSKCGDVKIYKRTNHKTGAINWACHGSLVASRIKIRDKRAIANPRKPKHRLLSFDPEAQQGVCEICGPTPMIRRVDREDHLVKSAWRCPGSGRDFRINKKYNLKRSDYNKMFKQQDGKCAICDQEWEQNLRVDHCHDTGNIRGLLCDSCNLGLGKFQDSIDILQSAIAYLSSHKLSSCS
jgi:hypothetical protein